MNEFIERIKALYTGENKKAAYIITFVVVVLVLSLL